MDLISVDIHPIEQGSMYRSNAFVLQNHGIEVYIAILVGGWTNPFEKYESKLDHFPK